MITNVPQVQKPLLPPLLNDNKPIQCDLNKPCIEALAPRAVID